MMKTCFQKSASAIWLGALVVFCLTLIAVLPQSKYAKQSDPGAAVSAAKPAALAVVKVSMRNMQFYPPSLTVRKGTTIEWKNDDLVSHTATSASFDSGSVGPGKSWRHTFTKAGQFPYVCTFHPAMRGVVIVK